MPETSISKICSIDGCNKKHFGRGWCQMHYARFRTHGDPNIVINIYNDPEKFFFKNIEIVTESGCWIFLGGNSGKGYGALCVHGVSTRAHRYSWTLHNGVIPDGLYVLHKCDVRCCVNPDHLFLGTPQENTDDMVRKGRQVKGGETKVSKLTKEQVNEIKKELSSNWYYGRDVGLAKKYNVNRHAIWAIKTGKTWSQL